MTFCGKCGMENPDDNQFCERCGSRLHRSDSKDDGDSSTVVQTNPMVHIPASTTSEPASKQFERSGSNDDTMIHMFIRSSCVDSKSNTVQLPKCPYTRDQQETYKLAAKVMALITGFSIVAMLQVPLTYTKTGLLSTEVDLTLWTILSDGMVGWGAFALLILGIIVIASFINPSFGYAGAYALFLLGIYTANLDAVPATYLSYDYAAGDDKFIVLVIRALIPGILASIGGHYVNKGIIKYEGEIINVFTATKRLWNH